MNRGGALLVIAFLLIGYGIFGMDRSGTTTAATYYAGVVVLAICLVLLIRSGWRGNGGSWFVAAAGVFIATWVLYELVRQGPCLSVAGGIPLLICNAIPFSETAAPQLSAAAPLVTPVVGGLRPRRPPRASRGAPERDRAPRWVVRGLRLFEVVQGVLGAVGGPDRQQTMVVAPELPATTHGDEPRIPNLGEDHAPMIARGAGTRLETP